MGWWASRSVKNFLDADPKAYALWCTDAVLLRVRGLPERPATTLRAVNRLNGSEGWSADQDFNDGHDSPDQRNEIVSKYSSWLRITPPWDYTLQLRFNAPACNLPKCSYSAQSLRAWLYNHEAVNNQKNGVTSCACQPRAAHPTSDLQKNNWIRAFLAVRSCKNYLRSVYLTSRWPDDQPYKRCLSNKYELLLSTDIESRAPYVIMTLCMTGNISDVELDPLVSDLQSVGITSTSQATYQIIGVT